MSLGFQMGFEVSKAHTRLSLCLLPVNWILISQLLLQHHICLPAAKFSIRG